MPAPVSVAVIIPVYNGENYLAETLASVLAQTALPKEILVIDDGSTDGTAELARSFGPRVTVISRPNSGVGNARNFGASLATADWLAFLDHDDLWEPENLERQGEQIMLHPGADCSYCNRYNLRAMPGTNEFRSEPGVWVPRPEDLPRELMERCPFTPCSVLVRREKFHAVGGFDTTKFVGEDWKLWLTLSFHGARFVYSPERLVRYRIHNESASQKSLKVLKAHVAVIDECIVPRLNWFQRATVGRRLKSREMADAAVTMREARTPGSLSMMLRSIAYHPFHTPRRYKIAAHMALYGSVGIAWLKFSPPGED